MVERPSKNGVSFNNGNPVEHLRLASLYEKLNDKKKKDVFEIIELLEYADNSKVEAIKMLLR